MIKEGGRFVVPIGKNKKLDKVADEILNLLNDNDIHVSILITHEKELSSYEVLLCDEDNFEVAVLKVNEDDRLVREN